MNTEINFPDDFPILETDRLTLSSFEIKDVESFFNLRSDKEFMKYLGLHPMKKMSQARDRVHTILHAFKISEGITWKISLKGSNELIGYVGFWSIDYKHIRGEVGFGLHEEYQRQGLMTEALTAILKYGFSELGLHSVKADIDPRNDGSIGVLESTGFIKEAHLRENYFFDGEFLDSDFYGILESDFDA